MELDDLKKTWSSLSEQADQSDLFESKALQKQMKSGYRFRLTRLLILELILLVFNFYFAALFFFMFAQFETTLLENLARVSILFLLVLPVLRLGFLWQFYRVSDLQKTYSQTIEYFSQFKIRFQRLQQISFGVGFLLIASIAILSTKLYNEYDVTQSANFWIITFLLGLAFLFAFYKWIIKPYNKSIKDFEDLLKDLK